MSNIFLQVEPTLWGACFWYWLWTGLAFLLGCLICRLLSGGGTKHDDYEEVKADRDRYHAAATKWETDYQSLKYQLEESQKAEADLRAALQRCESDKHLLQVQVDQAGDAGAGGLGAAVGGFVAGTHSGGATERDDTTALGVAGGTGGGSVYAGLFDSDNFQIIEGVGPKVNQVLIDAGYKTWDDLAKADADDIRKHLDAAGKRFSLCDPTSWPHQAGLAAAGEWDELIRYQRFTDGGRETTGDFDTPSKFEKLATKKLGFSSTKPEDLKVIEGVGPKIESLLKEGGINNWAELANTSVERIQEILDAAGSRYKLAKPGTWPQQARLAADGNWSALKALQDELNGGV
jgi:predicted flap endonuclease-1-like 5' DNA nuclease